MLYLKNVFRHASHYYFSNKIILIFFQILGNLKTHMQRHAGTYPSQKRSTSSRRNTLANHPNNPPNPAAMVAAVNGNQHSGGGGGHPVIYPWMKKVHVAPGKGGKID